MSAPRIQFAEGNEPGRTPQQRAENHAGKAVEYLGKLGSIRGLSTGEVEAIGKHLREALDVTLGQLKLVNTAFRFGAAQEPEK